MEGLGVLVSLGRYYCFELKNILRNYQGNVAYQKKLQDFEASADGSSPEHHQRQIHWRTVERREYFRCFSYEKVAEGESSSAVSF